MKVTLSKWARYFHKPFGLEGLRVTFCKNQPSAIHRANVPVSEMTHYATRGRVWSSHTGEWHRLRGFLFS